MAQCPCPINVKDPRAKSSSVRLVVPCTKCPICLQNRRTEWSIRLGEELRTAKTAWFLTLTYDDENIKYKHWQSDKKYTVSDLLKIADKESIQGITIPTLDKTDLQKFHKRLRKHNAKQWDLKLRFYAVGEYGSQTGRPHYHAIYFNLHKNTIEKLQEIWGLGHIQIGTCTPASIHYTTKYMINNFKQENYREKPKAMMSLKPAIGAKYLERNDAWHVHNKAPYMMQNGKKVRLPRYYKDRIFTESEKEELAKNYQSIADKEVLNAWEEAKKRQENYDVERIRKIENQFRIINKQSKSK